VAHGVVVRHVHRRERQRPGPWQPGALDAVVKFLQPAHGAGDGHDLPAAQRKLLCKC
jgi:hypothetical protein